MPFVLKPSKQDFVYARTEKKIMCPGTTEVIVIVIFGSWWGGVHCCILRNASAQHEVWWELLGLLVWAFRAVLPAPGDIWGSGPYLAWILRPGGTFHPQNSGNRGSMAIWGAFMSYRPFWACELPKLRRLWYFDWFSSCRGNWKSLFELHAFLGLWAPQIAMVITFLMVFIIPVLLILQTGSFLVKDGRFF